jgi:acyl-CoA synthetase (AMP-forming)/AMP-acid ligase II
METDSERTLVDRVRRHASNLHDKPIFKFEGRVTTFAEFDERTDRAAAGLHALGVRKGERIGYLGKNTDAFFELWFGAMKLGAVMTPIGWRLAIPEVLHILRDARIRVLYVGLEFIDHADTLSAEIPDLRVVAESEGSRHPGFRNWLGGQENAPPTYEAQPDDIAIQLYTSGTTGQPKGVMLSQNGFVKHLRHIGEANVEWNRWTSDDVGLVVMPVAHIAGSGWGAWSAFFGATAIIERQFSVESVFDNIERERISKLFVVPAALQMMVRDPRAPTIDYGCLRQISYGASPISPTLLRECIDVFGCEFVQMYGMTETSGTIVALPPEDHHPDGTPRMKSAGKPLPGVEVAIIGPAGERLGPGAVGEIITRSLANMSGYWNQPEATSKTLDFEGWLHTGDAGYLDQDGYLYIHDRIKDMIISGGENIYPTEIENTLSGHPDVAEVAAIGVPDERWGEAVKAFVVLRPGRTAKEAELLDWLRPQIAAFKVPKSIEFRDALPRNASGKLLKRSLREPYWSNMSRNVA